MPEMDGVSVLKILKEMYTDLPIIAQTAYAMANDQQKFLEQGCDGYLTKPVIKEKLLALIEKALK